MKWINFIFIFLLPISVSALECNILNEAFCEEIESMDLEQGEIDALYTALTYNEHPDFDLVLSYNKEVEAKSTETDIYDSTYIKNAWLEIISLEPTIKIEDNLYSPGDGELLYIFDYDVQLPTGTFSGDCKTTFSVEDIHHNAIKSINSHVVDDILLTEDALIEIELNIHATIHIHRYWWREEYGNLECKHYSTQERTDSISLNDSLYVKHYDPSLDYTLDFTHESYDSIHGDYSISEATAYKIKFDDSYIKKNDWYYEYLVSDNNIVTINANYFEKEESKNIYVEGNKFVVQEPNNCEITLYSHFNSINDDCFEEISFDNISLSTDKNYYSIGETIFVTVEPPEKTYTLSYGDNLQEISAGTELTADQSGLISISNGSKEISQMVHVKSGNWGIFFRMLFMLLTLHFLIEFSKYLWRRCRR